MVFINQNKDQIRIDVRVRIEFDGTARYVVHDVMVKPYRKRKEISISSGISNRYEYRVLDAAGREEYVQKVFLEYCTQDQINQAIQEAYAKLAPSEGNVEYKCW